MAPRRPLLALLVMLAACRTSEPAHSEAQPKPEPEPPRDEASREQLVQVSALRLDEPARRALANQLGPDSAVARAEAVLAVDYKIAAGWHIYWKNPGDSGLPTRIEIEGATAGPVVYPAPEPFTSPGGLRSFGWKGRTTLFVPLARDPGEGLRLTSRHLACRESCIPGRSEHGVPAGQTRGLDEGIRAIVERVPRPLPAWLRAQWSDLELELTASDEATGRVIGFFPYASEPAMLEDESRDDRRLALRYRMSPSPDAPPPGQGVVHWSDARGDAFFELALPWPSTQATSPP